MLYQTGGILRAVSGTRQKELLRQSRKFKDFSAKHLHRPPLLRQLQFFPARCVFNVRLNTRWPHSDASVSCAHFLEFGGHNSRLSQQSEPLLRGAKS